MQIFECAKKTLGGHTKICNFAITEVVVVCSVLDKLATKYNKIFQLHLDNVATLPCKNLK